MGIDVMHAGIGVISANGSIGDRVSTVSTTRAIGDTGQTLLVATGMSAGEVCSLPCSAHVMASVLGANVAGLPGVLMPGMSTQEVVV